MDNLGKASKLIGVCFMLSLICWPYYAFQYFGFFIWWGFSDLFLDISCLMVWSYPFVIWLSIAKRKIFLKDKKEKPAFLFSLLPLVNIITVISILVILQINHAINDAKGAAKINRESMDSPRCPDGRWIYWERGNPYTTINIVERSNGAGSHNGFIFHYLGNMVSNHLNFASNYAVAPGRPCSNEESCLEYINQCRDANNRTIFEIIKGEK